MSEMDSDSPSDMEDVTITRALPVREDDAMDEDTPMELSILAASARITELSYSVADIQTRLFEIQELRHVDDSVSSGDASLAIERALAGLMESIVSVGSSLEEVNKAMAPAMEAVKTSTEGQAAQINEHEPVLRKHAALLSEWQNIQSDVSRLRSELQEDQLLVRFRTAVDQAAGMMDSLDKAVEACQEYMSRRGKYLRTTGSESAASRTAEAMANFTQVVDHYERVKKYYMQSSTQAMASIDKTIHSRDIKNGEVLRRHTELSARWKSIRDRIARTDREIEALRRPPDPDPSEAGSVRSRTTASSRPESQSTTLSTSESVSMSTLSQSLSPFRKLASRMTSGFRTPNRKEKDKDKSTLKGMPSMPPPAVPRTTSPINRRVMSPSGSRPAAQSIFSTPSHNSSSLKLSRVPSTAPPKPRWNFSTKPIEDTYATVKPSPPRPSIQGHSRGHSVSGRQSSMSGRQTPASAAAKNFPRAAASRPQTPGSGARKRPPTPSQIPAPIEVDIGPPSLQRTLATPILGPPSIQGTLTIQTESPEHLTLLTPPKARRASQSRIPAPAFRPSRPTSPSVSTSSYFPDGSTSPSALSTAFLSAAASPIGSTGQSPFNTMGPITPTRPPGRTRAPPSSFRGTTPMPGASRPQSRPSSRASVTETSGRRTSLEKLAALAAGSTDQLAYSPNAKDALDVELARVVNSMVHGYYISRVTPIVGAQQGPESTAQYAFENAMGRKVLTCKLVVVEKSAPRGSLDGGTQQTRRVICRVGGGWESLSAYLARGV
ncbi:hypothetical protein RhiJN_16648 [Ceratobasidium sp. AG-Ba]|nr:hypothetical protein RhiJN_16648 [Ceratobasidium sp. AG-Ba]